MTTASSFDGYVDILGPDDTQAGRAPKAGLKDVKSGPRQLPSYIARPYALIRAIPDGGTYLGVFLIIVGFVLLAICWGKVAGLQVVAYQTPYIASAGMTGLGLIVTGIAIVSAASREKDAALRRAQLSELASTLRTLRALLDEPAVSAPADTATATALELTTELAAILDEPLDDGAAVKLRRPVKVTGRATKTTRAAAAKRQSATAATGMTKTAKRVSR